jgi:hypothetical protein
MLVKVDPEKTGLEDSLTHFPVGVTAAVPQGPCLVPSLASLAWDLHRAHPPDLRPRQCPP